MAIYEIISAGGFQVWVGEATSTEDAVMQFQKTDAFRQMDIPDEEFFDMGYRARLRKPTSDVDRLQDDCIRLRERIAELEAERDHWKANHDNQVKLKQAISQRPDLGDRAARVAELLASIKVLELEVQIRDIKNTDLSDRLLDAVARLGKWESIFNEADPEKEREYHQQLVAEKNATIEELRYTNQQLRALRRDVDAVRPDELLKRIAELEAELATANASIKEHEDAFAIQNRDMKELLATISALRAELAKAPRWVPVGEWVRDSGYHVVYGSFFESEPTHHDAKQNRYDVWLATNESKLDVTHVLANLNPPEIATNEDQERLREMAAKEDNGCDPWYGSGYQLIAHSEIIKNGDEYLSSRWPQPVWKPCVNVGIAYCPATHCQIRRKTAALNEILDNGCISVGGLVCRVKAAELHNLRDSLIDIVDERHLTSVYHCTRVWSAWGVGTMSEADFEPANESTLAGEIVDSILSSLALESKPVAKTATQCVDMLGRDVVDCDVMWGALLPDYADALIRFDLIGATTASTLIRVPRQGEPVPDFPNWREMCLAMQASGAEFEMLSSFNQWAPPGVRGQFEFSNTSYRYRRSESCKWSGPK